MAGGNRLTRNDADGRCYELDGRPVRDGDQLDLEMEAFVDGRLRKVWRPGRYEWSSDSHGPPRLYLYGCDAIFVRLTAQSVLRWSSAPEAGAGMALPRQRSPESPGEPN